MNIEAGTVYGDLIIVEEVARSSGNRRFLCKCSCGDESVKFLGNLRGSRGVSCDHLGGKRGAAGRLASSVKRRERAQITEEGRLCFPCKTWKPWESFAAGYNSPNGRSSLCYECTWWKFIERKFGITRGEWESMLDAQSGCCALCGHPPPSADRRLVIDHDHGCCPAGGGCKKCIRGLLCDHCNLMLGRVERSPLLMRRFSDYLPRRPLAVPRLSLAS